MMFKGEYDKAQICISHAQYIANKYSININFDTEQSHYVSVETKDENDLSVNPITPDDFSNKDSNLFMVSSSNDNVQNEIVQNEMLDAIYPNEESEG